MDNGYKIKATYETHDPKKIQQIMDKKPLVGGTGLLSMLQDTISGLGDGNSMPMSSPFHVLDMNDFGDDPVISAFKNMGGPEHIVKVVSLPEKEAHHHLHQAFNKLNNIKLAEERNTLRYAYMALQNFLNKDNDAARLERVAYKTTDKSAGYWQIEAINTLDKLKKFASTSLRISKIESARNVVLSGNKLQTTKVSNYLHNWYSEITPKENRRVAYTTLSTQANEPYLLCPKGKFQGFKAPIPMEISKCRENCIDSRVDKEGHVTCAYQDWLKVAFQSHDEVMARLDVHKHPDNEANALELEEGERSKKLTEGEIGFEARFDNSDRGANKVRGKHNLSDSMEKQLSDAKQSSYGHQQGDKPVMRPKQAQTDSSKTIDSQLPRQEQKGTEYLEVLLRKLNGKDSITDEVLEDQLDSDGLYTHRGEMEESYADQLNVKGKDPINYRDELNKDKDEPKDSIIHQLDKTASKKELNQEQILNETRKKKVADVPMDEQLEDTRQNNKIKVNIETLLNDEDDDSFGHQFSDDDLKKFADELGLDYVMESKKEKNTTMWYKQVLAQVGGGVNLSGETKPIDTLDSQNDYKIDEIRNVDSEPAGLYDELDGILEKMGKTLDEYYHMNQDQQKEIWDLLVDRPHRMNMDNNGQFIVSPQSASIEARRHSPYHDAPENTTIEGQLEGSRQQNNNRDPQSMASKEKGNGFQHFKSGEGYYQASKGKQDPILFGNKPSNQTWY